MASQKMAKKHNIVNILGKEDEDFTLGFVTFRAPQTAKEVSQLTDIKLEEQSSWSF